MKCQHKIIVPSDVPRCSKITLGSKFGENLLKSKWHISTSCHFKQIYTMTKRSVFKKTKVGQKGHNYNLYFQASDARLQAVQWFKSWLTAALFLWVLWNLNLIIFNNWMMNMDDDLTINNQGAGHKAQDSIIVSTSQCQLAGIFIACYYEESRLRRCILLIM